jgi:hypothetical protein
VLVHEERDIVLVCEAVFALPHKASFDDGQWKQRFAALNQTKVFFKGDWICCMLCCYCHTQAAPSHVEPLVQADITQRVL